MRYINLINKRLLIALFALSGLSIFFACDNLDAREDESRTPEVADITYDTEVITYMQPEYTITIPGELEPNEQVSLFAKIEGFVKTIHVDIGDQVKKGQLLAVLEAPELNQRYVSDKSAEQKVYSDYQYAQQNYERLLEASKTEGAVAALELERAKSAMNSALSAYEASKAQTGHSEQMQNYLRITAPFDGVITEKNVSEGALVGRNSGQPIFKLAQEDMLRLKIALPEKHAASVRDSMKVSFTVNSQPGKNYEALLSRSSRLINRTDRSMTLEFDVTNKEQHLNGGEYAQVKLNLQRRTPSFWVTENSILRTQSGDYVLTINDNHVRRTPIKEGIRLEDKIEVFGDFNKEDQVIIRPTERIQEGKI
ncbi:MAG TPA: efflux RND transporter periplasmic adaptor subunit [Flavobacteriaceae bacterium]|nr:efflux RND transporter periplasmic adaptor subunit [Flavobacteriaceae bacterium]